MEGAEAVAGLRAGGAEHGAGSWTRPLSHFLWDGCGMHLPQCLSPARAPGAAAKCHGALRARSGPARGAGVMARPGPGGHSPELPLDLKGLDLLWEMKAAPAEPGTSSSWDGPASLLNLDEGEKPPLSPCPALLGGLAENHRRSLFSRGRNSLVSSVFHQLERRMSPRV